MTRPAAHRFPDLPALAASAPADRLAPAALVLRLFARIGHEIAIFSARRRLEALDDRRLADIGLSRADIDWAVREGR